MRGKVLVYGCATGVFSSRKIERRLHEDLAFRMLGAGNFPKHRTIRDFRALHLQELSDLLVQVVKLAQEMGLVKQGTVAIDGTKIKANASRRKAMSYERMQQAEAELKAQIGALLERARSADASEASEPEVDIPAEIERREDRLNVITAARQCIEQRQREADIERGRSEGNECKRRDEDGNPKGGRYKRQSACPAEGAGQLHRPGQPHHEARRWRLRCRYNAQTAVDEHARIIVAAELGNNAADVGQLVPMLGAAKANTGKTPGQALADAGYRSEENFKALAGSGTQLVEARGREGKQCAQVDADKNRCTAAMAAKLQSEAGKTAYRKSKWIAEPPNGWIKSVLGFRQFSLRGLHRVQAEFKLVCQALNLRRMGSLKTSRKWPTSSTDTRRSEATRRPVGLHSSSACQKLARSPPRSACCPIAATERNSATHTPSPVGARSGCQTACRQGRVRMPAPSCFQGRSAGSAAIGPAALATRMRLAMGVKSARKWLELLTTMIFMASACTPSMRSSSRSISCILPLTTATSTPSVSSSAQGPSVSATPVIIGPLSVTRPSASARTV